MDEPELERLIREGKVRVMYDETTGERVVDMDEVAAALGWDPAWMLEKAQELGFAPPREGDPDTLHPIQ
ncbi:hypothetical protein ACIU1J_27685 [Azospirillum doebereinerae]|uniref:hypothetical protein n=1 Tax=Azospirillum doebereinerae TaxID=92933 RepID=UPI001EE5ADE0|nr:hypothetical protein [Azospirillum doebereinerae]MCG5241402.1 hypothetical protein [Azospirillum doebereinerae]